MEPLVLLMICLKKICAVIFLSKNKTIEVRRLNKMLTSAIVLGAGVAAYNAAQKNNLISGRKMKKLQKRMAKALF